jgi:hypothetical protein
MKIDPDLVRTILLKVETDDLGKDEKIDLDLPGHDYEQVNYHVGQLIQAGYLQGYSTPDLDDESLRFEVTAMTWNGHQYIETIRDNRIWSKTKSAIAEKGGAMTIEILTAVAIQMAKQVVGLT